MIRAIAPPTFFLLMATLATSAEPTPEQAEHFEKKVRPILVERCYECHSEKTLATNDGEAKGNLRLDGRKRMLAGGDTGPAFEPGQPDKSLMVEAIRYTGLYKMPPIGKLPDDEIATLTQWIADGAPWPGDESASDTKSKFDLAARKAAHWCWRPIVDPPVPAVKNNSWPVDPIDHFILAKLEAENFTPAAIASPRARLRRLSFDLLGLPPSPEELAAFEADPSPLAWEQAVDRMLASPRFGERWGRHWLDLARYAETRGHEFDFQAPNAWAYRDYVIRAWNLDLPYTRFAAEQIAGDLMPDPRRNPSDGSNESIVGTSMWMLGEWVHSPVDIVKDEADRYDNMLDVFGKSFLGLTIACARCHDHKFDAISTHDYYALSGVLQSSGYRLARYDTDLDERRIASELEALRLKAGGVIASSLAAEMWARAQGSDAYALAALELAKPAANGAAADLRERVEAAAKAKTLSPRRLLAWTTALQKSADDPTDVLHALAKIYGRESSPEARRDLLKSLTNRRSKEEAIANLSAEHGEVVIDYSQSRDRSDQAQWLTDGPTFGAKAILPGEVLVDDDLAKGFEVATYGAARRDATWNGLKIAGGMELDPGALGFERAGKTLRTPTFELSDGRVHYLVRGAGRVYACVDSHAVVLGPLHGQVMFSLGENGAAPIRWVTQDLRPYQGHRIHVEFTPHADQDLQVLMVVSGPKPPDWMPASPAYEIARVLSKPAADATPGDGLSAEQAVRAALGEIETSLRNVMTHQKSDEASAPLVNWAMRHRPLFATDDEFASSDEKVAKLFTTSRQASAAMHKIYAETKQHLTSQITPVSRLAMALWDGTGENDKVMVRGNPHVRGKLAERRLPEALAANSLAKHRGSGRLELAEQLFRDDNPLTRRVLVNRLWAHLFGRGIVPSVDNFGVLGSPPSHPELLDHLATRFGREGWSIKQMIRAMVCTQTYQMSSAAPPDANARDVEERDPTNRLWRRQNVKRLEAEVIRDSLLALSGRLSSEMFGPSVPLHLTDHLQGRGRPGNSGPRDGGGRRSVYQAIRRNFPNPFLTAFDAPTPLGPVGQRNVSNVPAQALILLNDPLVIDQMKIWAEPLARQGNLTPAGKLDQAMQTALGRMPTAAERTMIDDYASQRAEQLKIAPASAWTDPRIVAEVCHVLVNAKEFVFIE